MTRSKMILGWFATVALVVVGCIAWGIEVGAGTSVMLLGLSLVPPAMILVMWPGIQPPTVAEVLRGGPERRT